MRISHTYPPASFKFLNRIGMRIILNKQGGVGMGAIHLEPVLLSSLNEIFPNDQPLVASH